VSVSGGLPKWYEEWANEEGRSIHDFAYFNIHYDVLLGKNPQCGWVLRDSIRVTIPERNRIAWPRGSDRIEELEPPAYDPIGPNPAF
jgi:hypothetical protein